MVKTPVRALITVHKPNNKTAQRKILCIINSIIHKKYLVQK